MDGNDICWPFGHDPKHHWDFSLYLCRGGNQRHQMHFEIDRSKFEHEKRSQTDLQAIQWIHWFAFDPKTVELFLTIASWTNDMIYELMNLSIWNCSISRVVSDFSDLYQPIFTLVFLRSILTLCCAMLVIQMEIVKYKFIHKILIHFGQSFVFCVTIHSPVEWWKSFDGTISTGIWCVHYVCCCFRCMWAWPARGRSQWRSQWFNWSISFVSISNGNKTNPTNGYACCTKTSNGRMFWQLSLLSRYI